MTFSADHGNDTRSSPGTDGLASLMPYAIAFLSADDTGYASLKDNLRTWAKDDPVDALLGTVLGGGLAFYLAERESNPACKSPWDGILYIATCLSVGYDNLFPTTTTGHALATAVQTFGPALATRAFDPTAAESAAADADAAAVNRAIVERLDTIIKLLEARS